MKQGLDVLLGGDGEGVECKKKCSISFDPIIPFLGIYPKGIALKMDKTYAQR